MSTRYIILAILSVFFSVIALEGVNGHIKLGVGTALATITAVTLNQWSAIVTIAWGALQIGLLIPDYWKMWKNRHGS